MKTPQSSADTEIAVFVPKIVLDDRQFITSVDLLFIPGSRVEMMCG